MSDETTKINEVVARPARTALQATPAWIIVELVHEFFYHFTDQQFSILVLFLTLVFGAAQTAYENYIGKGLLRKVPPTSVPAVDAK